MNHKRTQSTFAGTVLGTNLGHFLPVGLRVERGLCEQDGVVLGGDPQLVVEAMVPDLLHVVPVLHNAMLQRIAQIQDSAVALGLVTDVAFLLPHAHHDILQT